MIAASLQQKYTGNFTIGNYSFAVSLWSFEELRLEEEIRSRICKLDTNIVMDADASWGIINSLRIEGDDWLSAVNEIENIQFKNSLENCLSKLAKDSKMLRMKGKCKQGWSELPN